MCDVDVISTLALSFAIHTSVVWSWAEGKKRKRIIQPL
jgi:hypothetical protein